MNLKFIRIINLIIVALIFLAIKLYSQNIYFGDLHLHSELSGDANGNIDSLYRFAKNVSKIDFVCFSEHNPTNTTWETMKQKANINNIPNQFITFCGYEWTSVNNGHRIVIYKDENPPVFIPTLFSLDTLLKLLRINNGLALIAHSDFYPYQSNPVTTVKDSKIQNNIEVQGYNGFRYEYYNNQYPPFNQLPNHSVQDWLIYNEPLGIIANSDDHTGNPGSRGLTAIIADSLTRESLFDSIKKRHNYATSGAKIKLNFSCTKGIMGDSITCEENEIINFNIYAKGTNKIKKIEILKNNITINTVILNDTIVNFNFPLEFQTIKNNVYIRVHQIDNQMAWTSPIFIYKDIATQINNEQLNADGNKYIYPNPFNNNTKLTLYINKECIVEINIYDILGRKISEIFNGKKNKGIHEFNIDASQIGLKSGVYYCKIKYNNKQNTVKMIVKK